MDIDTEGGLEKTRKFQLLSIFSFFYLKRLFFPLFFCPFFSFFSVIHIFLSNLLLSLPPFINLFLSHSSLSFPPSLIFTLSLSFFFFTLIPSPHSSSQTLTLHSLPPSTSSTLILSFPHSLLPSFSPSLILSRFLIGII